MYSKFQPIILIIGWRGSPFINADEPQHNVKGKITSEILKLFHTHGVLKNDQISIMGPSGGDMAMIGDVAESLSLKFGKIPSKIIYPQRHAWLPCININHRCVLNVFFSFL